MIKPDVTVLMVVRNEEKYVGDTIRSILRQTYRNFIFFIIDDGSTDKTWELIQSFKDNRINAIHFDGCLGLTKRLNWGLRNINTEFVARMDSHNISDKFRLGKQRDFMLTHPDIVLIGSNSELTSEDIFKKNVFKHSSWFFRYEIIKREGFYNENFRYAQDYELLLRLAPKYKMVNLPDDLIRKIKIKTATSQSHWLKQAGFAFRAKIEALIRRDYPIRQIPDIFWTRWSKK